VDVGANATQHILSDLQEGVWYTITMFAKSQSTVAGPVIVTLGKLTDYIIIESVDSICRDSADTQYTLIQANFSKSPKQLTYKPL